MSYGTNAPQGLQPKYHIGGSTWNGQTSEYLLNGNINGGGTSYATSLFKGDPVTLLVDGTIGIGTAGNQIIGVFWGVEYYDANGIFQRSPYWTASTPTFNHTNPTVLVVDDPSVLYSIQAVGTGLVTHNVNTINIGLNANGGYQSDLNYNYNFAAGAGSTITGQSGYYLDMTTQATTATLNLKLIHLDPIVGNTFGLAYNNGLVLINANVYKSVGTAGV